MGGSGFISYLGPNTVAIARQLGDRLSNELGIDLTWAAPSSPADLQTAIATGQTYLFWMCGLLTVRLIDSGRLDAEIVAAPVFPGEPGPVYHSVVVARREDGRTTIDDLAGSTLAVNDRGSWSGYHALRAHFAEGGHVEAHFGSVVETGSHVASIDRILAGGADCAAIDCSVWSDLAAHDDRLRELRIVARTGDRPAPPFSVSRSLGRDVRRAIVVGLTRSTPAGLDAIVAATGTDYDPIRRGMALAERVAW